MEAEEEEVQVTPDIDKVMLDTSFNPETTVKIENPDESFESQHLPQVGEETNHDPSPPKKERLTGKKEVRATTQSQHSFTSAFGLPDGWKVILRETLTRKRVDFYDPNKRRYR